MIANETVELQTATDENGKLILNIKTMAGPAIKKEKQVILLKLIFPGEDKLQPSKELPDSSALN